MTWETGKEKREKACLENHERLHKLFVENRFAFERERKRLIDEVINSAGDEEQRTRLLAQQESWDSKMKMAGSTGNRLVLARFLFQKHVEEVWNPAIQKFSRALKDLSSR